MYIKLAYFWIARHPIFLSVYDAYGSVANEMEACSLSCIFGHIAAHFIADLDSDNSQTHECILHNMLTWITSCRRLVKPIRSDMNIPFLSYLRFDLRLPLGNVFILLPLWRGRFFFDLISRKIHRACVICSVWVSVRI